MSRTGRGSASMMQGDAARAVADAQAAVTLMSPIGDSWVLVHAEALLGAIAQATHRFEDAAGHLRRAAADSDRLGFAGQAAYHRTRLGRVQHQGGDRDSAADTLAEAVVAAVRCGDLRMAATARVNLARVLRDTGRTEDALALLRDADGWFDGAGGGDGALLARVLLASMSFGPDGAPVDALLEQAQHNHDQECEVLTLDLLARAHAMRGDRDRAAQLLDTADALTPMAMPVVDAVDRVDAHATRKLIQG
jgi:tetratricopeptide (TPR) repeat protein